MAIRYKPVYQSEKAKHGNGRWLFLLLFLILLSIPLWIFLQNPSRWLFYFQSDKHASLEIRSAEIVTALAAGESDSLQKLIEFTETLKQLSEDHPADSYLPYITGRLTADAFLLPLAQHGDLREEILFRSYTGRFYLPAELNPEEWKRAVLLLRRSMAMNPPEAVLAQIHYTLGELYYFGGPEYWPAGLEYLELSGKGIESSYYHLYNVYLQNGIPDWNVLTLAEERVNLLKGMHFLKAGNTPLGISGLSKLLLSTDFTVKNRAAYILAHYYAAKNQKNMQLFYLKQVDPENFLPRNPYFLQELHFLLRFFGANAEATVFLSQYEKLTLGDKPQE